MQVLHSLWDTETFHIWSESSALPLVHAGKTNDFVGLCLTLSHSLAQRSSGISPGLSSWMAAI